MSSLTALLLIVMPVFLLVASGYLAVRLRIFADPGLEALLKFATGIAIPVLLFRATATLDLGAAVDPLHLGAFYLAATLCFIAAMALSRRVWKRRPGESVAVAFGALFSNSVLLGLPIMGRAYDGPEVQAMVAIIAIHAPFCYLVGILTMEFARRDGVGIGLALARTAKAMFQNALTIGLFAGLAFNLAGGRLPGPLDAATEMLADAALPVALFGLGGVLTRYSLKAEIGEAGMVAAFSLLVHPALAWAFTSALGLPEAFVRAAVVTAAMPTGINGYVFAHMYDRAVGTAASTVLLGTALAPFTITLWLALLGGAHLG